MAKGGKHSSSGAGVGKSTPGKPPAPVFKSTNFIILIGGPGKFAKCDPHQHDTVWTNYIVPIQLATSDKELNLDKNESVQWWVYGPAYQERWDDDKDNPQRKKAVDKVKSQGASDYLDRIRQVANGGGASLTVLSKPQDFWDDLKALPDQSVSRVWYIGHASADGLMLKLTHNAACEAAAFPADMIVVADIQTNSPLVASKLVHGGKPSKFLGCTTKSFAEQWNQTFNVTTEGATAKIDFGVIDAPSSEPKIINRLQSSESTTGWTNFPSKAPKSGR